MNSCLLIDLLWPVLSRQGSGWKVLKDPIVLEGVIGDFQEMNRLDCRILYRRSVGYGYSGFAIEREGIC
jgi:hypothetical protein